MEFPLLKVLFSISSFQFVLFPIVNCDDAPQVTLANGGVVRGITVRHNSSRPFNAFMEIPYATIPERFQEAKLITSPPWQGVFNATKTGTACPQAMRPDSVENCLVLSVFVPHIKREYQGDGLSTLKPLPVMIWIHGGAFVMGAGSLYQPHYLMNEDVILVTINYRLGVFGFLSTGDNVIPGNAALKDMVLALKWVEENIRQFYESPSKRTIFGESAGGAAVQYLMLSPTTDRLFENAISQSGSALNMWAFQPDPRQYSVKFAASMNCSTEHGSISNISSTEILKCLQKAPMKDLLRAQHRMKSSIPSQPDFGFVPTAEPSTKVSSLTPFITESPMTLLANNATKLRDIPWIVGANEDESSSMHAGLILSNPKLLITLNNKWNILAPHIINYGRFLTKEEQDAVSKKLRDFYFPGKNISEETRDAVRNVMSDGLFLHGIIRSAKDVSLRGENQWVYLYQYAYKGSRSDLANQLKITGEELKRVGHADELQQLFYSQLPPGKTPEEEVFSKHFVRLWASFAQQGKPSETWGKKSSEWTAIHSEHVKYGVACYKIQAEPKRQKDLDQSIKDRMKLWDEIWDDTILPAIKRTKMSSSS